MKRIFYIACVSMFCLASCSSPNKLIRKNQVFLDLRDRTSVVGGGYEMRKNFSSTTFKAKIVDKGDYVIILPVKDFNEDPTVIPTIIRATDQPKWADVTGKKFYPDVKTELYNPDKFVYYDIKFGIQALTIPLKFRKSIGNDTLNPPTAETGFNLGFAPGWKFTKNIMKPTKNYLGKSTTQLSIVVGPHFGLGATDLKKATNAPGLLSDRKAPMFTYGAYILMGFNNINFGFAVGRDYILGRGSNQWVYQDRCWKGIIVSLDVLKF